MPPRGFWNLALLLLNMDSPPVVRFDVTVASTMPASGPYRLLIKLMRGDCVLNWRVPCFGKLPFATGPFTAYVPGGGASRNTPVVGRSVTLPNPPAPDLALLLNDLAELLANAMVMLGGWYKPGSFVSRSSCHLARSECDLNAAEPANFCAVLLGRLGSYSPGPGEATFSRGVCGMRAHTAGTRGRRTAQLKGFLDALSFQGTPWSLVRTRSADFYKATIASDRGAFIT